MKVTLEMELDPRFLEYIETKEPGTKAKMEGEFKDMAAGLFQDMPPGTKCRVTMQPEGAPETVAEFLNPWNGEETQNGGG